jgi:hypothetical protein
MYASTINIFGRDAKKFITDDSGIFLAARFFWALGLQISRD